MCDKSKRNKTISVIIRNHPYVDGKGFRLTMFGDSNIHYVNCDAPMRWPTLTSLEDCISASNRDALQNLRMSLTEHEGTNSAHDDTLQEADARVDVHTVKTESESKPKSNKRKWLFGLGAKTVLAGIIAYVIKNK